MKILHLIDTLDYHGSARQLQLLAPALADKNTSVEVCCLGPETPWSEALRGAGVIVHTLGWTRWFDPIVPWSVRALVREAAPDVIHVWRPAAMRMLGIVARSRLPQVVMSAPLPSKGRLAWWDRWLLARVGCVAVAGEHEARRCEQAGIASSSMRVLPPIIATAAATSSDPSSILWIGRLEREAGWREAICAFDLVRQRFGDLRLQLVGAGVQESTLHALVTGLETEDHVEMLGSCPETSAHMQRAGVVWISSLTNVGRQVALEAMAHGRAVVAFDVPCLRDVISDRETGFLVPVGDTVQLARRTRDLLIEPALRQRMGEAARRQVETRWPLTQTIERWRELYRRSASRER